MLDNVADMFFECITDLRKSQAQQKVNKDVFLQRSALGESKLGYVLYGITQNEFIKN